MKLLVRSMLRHLRQHLLQTCLTMAVSILITGMIATLFHFASSFQATLRVRALEEYGAYHYQYYTDAGTGTARVFAEMARRFREDRWFSDVQFVEEGDEVRLILTVAHPGLFTTKAMEQKYHAVVEDCREWTKGEVFVQGGDHNWDLLASYGDLEKRNGIYSYLLIFLFLLASVSAAGVLTLGSVFRVSAMQREREIALLAGMGAERGQVIGMMLLESAVYCLVSLPAGFWLGIFAYRGVQRHIDNIFYSLIRLPSADLVVSVPYSVALAACALCVILWSGLRSAMRVSRISPMDALRRTAEIRIRGTERNAPSYQDVTSCGRWLAKKSWQRFQGRNRPILVMLAVTFALCFVLDGFRRYSTEVVKMAFGTSSYHFSIDLYSDDPQEMERLASALALLQDSAEEGGKFAAVREVIYELQSPYPFSELGEASLNTNIGMLPDVILQCVEEGSFARICGELGIPGDAEGLWGIFLNTERTWMSEGVLVKGRPYAVAAGEQIRLCGASGEEFVLTVAGVSDKSPRYAEVAESARMQILVPEAVFSILEERRPYRDAEPGACHISLRGNPEDGRALEKMVREQAAGFPEVTCRISDSVEQLRQERAGIGSFEFLCGALVAIFAFVCICGNVTLSWTANKAREREFATLLSVGMEPGSLRKMRLFELFYQVRYAFLPGVFAGVCAYQAIYGMYGVTYRVSWHFPLEGLLLGTAVLVVSVGVTDLALRLESGKRSLSEQLRMEE